VVAWFQRASALAQLQQWPEARQALERVIRLQPQLAEAHNNLGLVLKAQGQALEAAACFQRARQLHPGFADPYFNLAQLALDAGELPQALAWAQEALQRDGSSAQTHFCYGTVLQAMGRPVEAMEALQCALALQPAYPEALNNLGNILLNLDRKQESLSALEQARQLQPENTDVLANLANAQQQSLQLDRAEASLRQALALKPNFAAAHSNLGNVLNDQGRRDEALASYRRAIELGQHERDFIPNYLLCLNYSPSLSDAELHREHRRLCSAHYDPLLEPQPPRPSRSASRKLKLGYLSPDFCRHPVARFLLPVLAHHNREHFEVVAYSNRLLKDAITAECARHVDLWRDVAPLSDTQLAQQIRNDGIDILVDLAMHARDGRPGVFARRAAPVQLSYLAYVGTTGLAAMDYRITDAVLDPADAADPPWIEQPLRLPQCWWCFEPSPFTAIPEPSPPPCLQNGFITFGSLNNVIKLNSVVRNLWVRLVNAVPNARLLLHIKHTHSRPALLDALESQGLPRERVELVGYQSEADYMATYSRIDIALDPSPFAGGTTSFDALWMGVPLLTLPGERRSSRGGASILTSLGRPEWIAQSEAKFIAIGQQLAADPEQLAAIRFSLRDALRASPLMDHAGYSRALEALLQQAAAERLSWLASP
jgi:protein O-GlcNAc transferase